MPIIKSAIKKLRKDRKREKVNDAKRTLLKKAIKKAQKSKSAKDIIFAISTIDKAAKSHLLHVNKAARLKSNLSRLADLNKPKPQKPLAKPRKSKAKSRAMKTV